MRIVSARRWWEMRDAIGSGEQFRNSTKSVTGHKGPAWTMHRLPGKFHESAASADYTVRSYGTPIAWRIDGVWVVPDVRYSVTTSRHQSLVRVAVGELSN